MMDVSVDGAYSEHRLTSLYQHILSAPTRVERRIAGSGACSRFAVAQTRCQVAD